MLPLALFVAGATPKCQPPRLRRPLSTTAAVTISGLDTPLRAMHQRFAQVPSEPARSAMKCCNASGTFRSVVPNTNHDGMCFQAGASVGEPFGKGSFGDRALRRAP